MNDIPMYFNYCAAFGQERCAVNNTSIFPLTVLKITMKITILCKEGWER